MLWDTWFHSLPVAPSIILQPPIIDGKFIRFRDSQLLELLPSNSLSFALPAVLSEPIP